jgi:hypothetical protein
MVVCLVVISRGRGVVVYLSPCVNPRERELVREREHKNIRISVERGGRNTIWYMVSYRTVSDLRVEKCLYVWKGGLPPSVQYVWI